MTRLSPRTCVVVAALVLAADLLLLWPRAAAADAPTATGSWRIARQSTPVGEIPSSPVTDDGTLPVQNGPAGVLAFSGLRYDGTSGGVLTLAFAGQAPAVVPSILACRITGQWSPGADQTWDRRPAYDCARHATASGDAARLTWELGPGLAAGDVLDVALVPDPADPTPFAVSFELPAPGSFAPSGEPAPADLPAPVTGDGAGRGPAPAPAPAMPAAAPIGQVAAPGPAPVVAAPAAGGQPAYVEAPVAAVTVPRSRAAGAGALAALAAILLLRSFVFGGARSRTPRSLLTLQREGA